jgi:hypothetical protein
MMPTEEMIMPPLRKLDRSPPLVVRRPIAIMLTEVAKSESRMRRAYKGDFICNSSSGIFIFTFN